MEHFRYKDDAIPAVVEFKLVQDLQGVLTLFAVLRDTADGPLESSHLLEEYFLPF